MHWREHHAKNAKRCFILGTAVLIGGNAFGWLVWRNGWTEEREQLLFYVADFWILGICLLAAGFIHARKAGLLPAAPPRAADSSGERWPVPHREMMLKKLVALNPTVRYFPWTGNSLLNCGKPPVAPSGGRPVFSGWAPVFAPAFRFVGRLPLSSRRRKRAFFRKMSPFVRAKAFLWNVLPFVRRELRSF